MKIFLAGILSGFLFLYSFQNAVKAQPDYSFKNAVLVSGQGLQTGAMYKFSNVRANADAFVTIIAQTGGIRLTEIDNITTGFDEAFQPAVNMEKNSGGYIEFRLDFVEAGTNVPQVQNRIPVTCINVDRTTFSDGILNVQDQVQFFPGYYDYSIAGNKLEITIPEGWVAIKNISGLRHSNIDTFASDVMATVVNKNTSSFHLRVGGMNSSPSVSEARIRSVYFKSFSYGHMTNLPNRTMLSLCAVKKQNTVEIKGTLSASHSYDKIIIERAVSQNIFGNIGRMDISGNASAEFSFIFQDTKPGNGVNYYRVHMVGASTNVQEISNTLVVKMDNTLKDLEVVNTVLRGSNAVLAIISPGDDEADMLLADLSGRIIYRTKTKLNRGFNNISLPEFNAAKGYFVLAITTKNKTISRKIFLE